MADLQGLIKDDRLMSINYDKAHMQKVLDEILLLFQNQSIRLQQVEELLPTYATKVQMEKLNSDFIQHEKDSALSFSNINDSINGIKSNLDSTVQQLKEEIESTHLSMISEAKRLVDESIENFAPNFQPQTPEEPEICKQLKQEIDALQSKVDNLPVLQQKDFDAGDLNSVAMKVQQISTQLKNYPQIETDVNNLVLQFPTITKRIERKVNEVITAVDNWKFPNVSGNPSLKQFPNFNTFTKNTSTSPRIPDVPKPPTVVTEVVDDTIPGNREIAPIHVSEPSSPTQSSEKLSAEEEKPTHEEEEEKVGDLPIKSESRLKLIDEDVPQISTQELYESMKPLPEIKLISEELPPLPARPSAAGEQKEGDPFQIDVKSPQKVEIFETHTYKTEMKSSQRVVSDIEWLKTAVEQHHTAIRQLQTSIRVQQDNADNITNNLMRINAAHNAKETQLVAQMHEVRDDIDNLTVKMNDSISNIQRRLVSLLAASDSPKVPEVNEKQKDESPKVTITKNIRRMEPLTPLPTRSHPDSSSNTQRSEADTSERLTAHSDNSRRTYKFTFAHSHFTINGVGNFMITTIDNREPIQQQQQQPMPAFSGNASESQFSVTDMQQTTPQSQKTPAKIAHIDLFTSDIEPHKFTPLLLDPAGGFEAQIPANRPQPAEELEEPPKVNTETRKTIIIENSKRIMRTPFRPPGHGQNTPLQALPTEIPQDVIEEKVGKEARRVIAELQEQVNDSVKKQLEQMHKEVNDAVILVDNKIDRTFVEKMFNKFRVVIKELNEKIENTQCSFLDWVTRDELEIVLQKFLGMITNNTDTAGASSKFHCLLCGRPRAHLAGMLEEAPMPSPNSRNGSSTNGRTSSSVSALPSKPQTAAMQRTTVSVNMKPPSKMSRLPATKPNSPDRRPRDVIQLLTAGD